MRLSRLPFSSHPYRYFVSSVIFEVPFVVVRSLCTNRNSGSWTSWVSFWWNVCNLQRIPGGIRIGVDGDSRRFFAGFFFIVIIYLTWREPWTKCPQQVVLHLGTHFGSSSSSASLLSPRLIEGFARQLVRTGVPYIIATPRGEQIPSQNLFLFLEVIFCRPGALFFFRGTAGYSGLDMAANS